MALVDKNIEIKKSGSAMTCAISQLVYMPNFRAIGQSVWEKNGNTQTETQKDRNTDRNTDLNFIKIDNLSMMQNGIVIKIKPQDRTYLSIH